MNNKLGTTGGESGSLIRPNRALLVGINDYAPIGPGGPDLRGCVNDVIDMARTLNSIGVVSMVRFSMRFLTDAKATRERILRSLKELIKGATRGQTLVFYYSGHGTYVADSSGDEPVRDEALCPHDYATAGYIVDDDLRALFSGLAPGVKLEVILDSCFSGSGTRAVFEPNEGEQSRFVEPPIEDQLYLEGVKQARIRHILRPAHGGGDEKPGLSREIVPVFGLNHVLWAAAKDSQTAKEKDINSVRRGVFTYSFCDHLRKAGVAGITRAKLDKFVMKDVESMVSDQTPQCEGERSVFTELTFK